MQGQDLLKMAVGFLQSSYPGLLPESVVCFLFLMSKDGLTVGKIAAATGFTEPLAYRHLSALQKLDLINLVNTGTGANAVVLSEKGELLRDEINTVLSGG